MTFKVNKKQPLQWGFQGNGETKGSWIKISVTLIHAMYNKWKKTKITVVISIEYNTLVAFMFVDEMELIKTALKNTLSQKY